MAEKEPPRGLRNRILDQVVGTHELLAQARGVITELVREFHEGKYNNVEGYVEMLDEYPTGIVYVMQPEELVDVPEFVAELLVDLGLTNRVIGVGVQITKGSYQWSDSEYRVLITPDEPVEEDLSIEISSRRTPFAVVSKYVQATDDAVGVPNSKTLMREPDYSGLDRVYNTLSQSMIWHKEFEHTHPMPEGVVAQPEPQPHEFLGFIHADLAQWIGQTLKARENSSDSTIHLQP